MEIGKVTVMSKPPRAKTTPFLLSVFQEPLAAVIRPLPPTTDPTERLTPAVENRRVVPAGQLGAWLTGVVGVGVAEGPAGTVGVADGPTEQLVSPTCFHLIRPLLA